MKTFDPGAAGVLCVTPILGAGAMIVPLMARKDLWPAFCTRAEAQQFVDALNAIGAASPAGGRDHVQVDVRIVDYTGQSMYVEIMVPDDSTRRVYMIEGSIMKAGVTYNVFEYGGLVADNAPKQLTWSPTYDGAIGSSLDPSQGQAEFWFTAPPAANTANTANQTPSR